MSELEQLRQEAEQLRNQIRVRITNSLFFMMKFLLLKELSIKMISVTKQIFACNLASHPNIRQMLLTSPFKKSCFV